jgi:hypothetical protein
MEHARVRPTQEPLGAHEGARAVGKKASLVDALLEETRDDAEGRPTYSSRMSSLLAIVSSWAYADAETLSNVLHRQGLLHHRCEYFGIGNDALFVHARAFLIQSQCGRLGILCFRGTEPISVINWMVNASVSPRLFMPSEDGGGRVHGGFYRNVEALWPTLLDSLEKAVLGSPLFTGAQLLEGTGVIPLTEGGRGGSHEPGLRKLEALFITGHSLGGAMASLATALLFNGSAEELERTAQIRRVLRGVYTYGQPLVGDAAFARKCAGFDARVFRHVYANDIVPHLPPKAMGRFKHFGREYHWQNTTQRWEPSLNDSTQVRTVFLSNAIGMLDWFKQQVASLRTLRLKLPCSWEAHSPVHYMNASRWQSPVSAGAPWV